jgi:hypothetical protein
MADKEIGERIVPIHPRAEWAAVNINNKWNLRGANVRRKIEQAFNIEFATLPANEARRD